jgi:hypothetical protein
MKPPTLSKLSLCSWILQRLHCAQERTRTSMPFRALDPESSVSTNSTTWAGGGYARRGFYSPPLVASSRCNRVVCLVRFGTVQRAAGKPWSA